MKKKKEFQFENDVCQLDSDDDNWWYPAVENYPDNKTKITKEQNKLVTKRQTISIYFDYPLSKKVVMIFKNKKGFRYKDFYKAVYQGYKKIYTQEEKAVGSEGPYGIWGHDMGDLVLEGFKEIKPGVYELWIGS